MGFLVDSQEGCGKGGSWGGVKSLIRRKQVDSVRVKPRGQQLAKELSVLHLIAIGVGSTIGAGVYILVGTVAREHSGPALTISFLIAGIAAALSAFCYAELASRCPSAGSAYHYSYICVGECVAWLIGWAMILEYTIGGAAVARGISPNLALFFGGGDNVPAFLEQPARMPLTAKQLEEWKKYHGEQEFKIGRQYYKSGWLEKSPENFMGRAHKRWFQLRHWMLFYFPEEQDGWNYPEWGPDYKHEEEDSSSLLSFPGLDISLPSFSFPSLSMPDISMPSLSMPSMSMPSMSMPSVDLKNLKMPKRKERFENGPYGSITIYNGAKVKKDGKKIIISDATQLKIFKGENEEKKGRKFELVAEDDEEAESWFKSIVWGGAQEEA